MNSASTMAVVMAMRWRCCHTFAPGRAACARAFAQPARCPPHHAIAKREGQIQKLHADLMRGKSECAQLSHDASIQEKANAQSYLLQHGIPAYFEDGMDGVAAQAPIIAPMQLQISAVPLAENRV